MIGIDSSTATASVAVYRGQVLAEVSWRAGRKHSAQLLPTLERALDLAGVEKSSVHSIAVASGPGSYSGLRVGVSTALGLAMALNIESERICPLTPITFGM